MEQINYRNIDAMVKEAQQLREKGKIKVSPMESSQGAGDDYGKSKYTGD